jgi:hypothetical protein
MHSPGTIKKMLEEEAGLNLEEEAGLNFDCCQRLDPVCQEMGSFSIFFKLLI